MKELPGVGMNLHDHLQIRPVFRVNTETVNEMYHNLWKKIRVGVEYLLFQTGPLVSAPSIFGIFGYSNDELKKTQLPNIQYHIQPLSLQKFGEPLEEFNAITASVCNLRPTSRGHVKIRTADPLTPPEIKMNYLTTPED